MTENNGGFKPLSWLGKRSKAFTTGIIAAAGMGAAGMLGYSSLSLLFRQHHTVQRLVVIDEEIPEGANDVVKVDYKYGKVMTEFLAREKTLLKQERSILSKEKEFLEREIDLSTRTSDHMEGKLSEAEAKQLRVDKRYEQEFDKFEQEKARFENDREQFKKDVNEVLEEVKEKIAEYTDELKRREDKDAWGATLEPSNLGILFERYRYFERALQEVVGLLPKEDPEDLSLQLTLDRYGDAILTVLMVRAGTDPACKFEFSDSIKKLLELDDKTLLQEIGKLRDDRWNEAGDQVMSNYHRTERKDIGTITYIPSDGKPAQEVVITNRIGYDVFFKFRKVHQDCEKKVLGENTKKVLLSPTTSQGRQ